MNAFEFRQDKTVCKCLADFDFSKMTNTETDRQYYSI